MISWSIEWLSETNPSQKTSPFGMGMVNLKTDILHHLMEYTRTKL